MVCLRVRPARARRAPSADQSRTAVIYILGVTHRKINGFLFLVEWMPAATTHAIRRQLERGGARLMRYAEAWPIGAFPCLAVVWQPAAACNYFRSKDIASTTSPRPSRTPFRRFCSARARKDYCPMFSRLLTFSPDRPESGSVLLPGLPDSQCR